MGATEILDRIAADGAARVAGVAQERDRQAAATRERSDAEAARIKAEWSDKARRDAEAIVERARGTARLQLRNAALAARWLVLDRALDMARQRVLTDKSYPELMVGVVKKHAAAGSEVRLSESDVRMLAGRLGGLKLTVAQIVGGAVIRNGKEEVNFSLEETLAASREELAADLSRVLFGN